MAEMESTEDRVVVIGRGRLIADCPVAEFTGTGRAAVVRTPDAGELAVAVASEGGSLDRGDGGLAVCGT